MCEPVTMTAIGTSLGASASAAYAVGTFATMSAVGTGLSAYGMYQQGQSAKAQANYNAQVADNNAKVAEYAALDAQMRGDQEAMKARREGDQLKGAQRATMAARGLDLGQGTPLSLLDETDLFSQADQETIRNNAKREAWSIRNQKANYQSEATLQRMTARSINPGLNATTSLLSGAGSVGAQWYGRYGGSGASNTPKWG